MISRIPESERQRSVATRIAQVAAQQAQAMEMLSTGRRINRPSDDPAGAVRIMDLGATIALSERYQDNATQALEWNEFTGDVLQDVSQVLARARELTVRGSAGSLSSSDREALAAEMDSLLAHTTELANTKLAGRSVFGGSVGANLSHNASGDGVKDFSYKGPPEANSVLVGAGVSVGLGITPDSVFLSQDRGETRLLGNTGAKRGQGTDSATGFGSLVVAHETTTLGDGAGPGGGDSTTGLARGASTALDTVIGNTHTIQIKDTSPLSDGTAGSISLNGGPEIAWTSADTDLKVIGDEGEFVFLDMSNLVAGTDTQISLSATGTLSVDGGASTSAIDFTSNQTARDSKTGAVTHIDSSGITRAGSEKLTYAGTFGILGTLSALANELRNGRGLSEGDLAQELSSHLAELDRGENALALGFARVGASAVRAEAARDVAEDIKVRFEQLRSNVEDADFVSTVLEFQRAQEAYEATLQSTAQSSGVSLLDFLT